jgi:hypothetical protein
MKNTLTKITALAALSGSMACVDASATQFSFEPQVSWLVNYNSNLTLAPTGQQAIEGSTLALDPILKSLTETTEFDLKPHLDVQRFSSQQALDATDAALQGTFSTQQARYSISLSGGYEHASTLTTELSDTGIIDANTSRDTSSGGFVLGRELTERQHLELQGTYASVVFPGGERLGLIGYHYPSAALTDTLSLSPLTTLAVALTGDHLTAPQSGYDARDEGARLTLAHDYSMRVKLSAAAGFNETSTNSFTQHGYLWDLHATRNSELTQWDFDYGRTLQPSGRGYLIRRDQLSLTRRKASLPSCSRR